QFLHLRPLDRLLQNHFSHAKIARAVCAGSLLANKAHWRLEDAILAFRTFADRFLTGEIHFHDSTLAIAFVLSEIKFDFVFRSQPQHCGERTSFLAAKTLQRPDLLLTDEGFHLMAFE